MRGRVRTVLLIATFVAVLVVPMAASAEPGATIALTQPPVAQVETIILASGRNFPDALAGSILSYACDAPVMLTEPTALPLEVKNEIQALGVSKVIILGGEKAIGPEVVSALNAFGITDIERIAGGTRFQTSALIAARGAVAVQDAKAARTAEIQDLVADAIAGIQSQIDDLVARVTGTESDIVSIKGDIASIETSVSASEQAIRSLETSMGAVEAAMGGSTNFWPEGLSVAVSVPDQWPPPFYGPRISGDWWELADMGMLFVKVDISHQGTPVRSETILDSGGPKTTMPNSLVILHIDGQDYYRASGMGEPPTEGAPIEIEYWFELYGEQYHGTRTLPGGWTYDRQ